MFAITALRLTILLWFVASFQEISSIGQNYCYKKESCPTVKRIPYNIPPVMSDDEFRFVEDVRSIFELFQTPDLLILQKNMSDEDQEDNETLIPEGHRAGSRTKISGLELMYYKILPSDAVIALIIGGLLLCALIPRVLDCIFIAVASAIFYNNYFRK